MARFSPTIPHRALQSILKSFREEKFLLSILQRKKKTDGSNMAQTVRPLLSLQWSTYVLRFVNI